MDKIDVTHTVKESERPSPEARLMHDMKTGRREWVVPEGEAAVAAPPAPKRRKKKDSEGDK